MFEKAIAPSTMATLRDARYKIDRAKKHIVDADAALKRPSQESLYPEVIEHDWDAMIESSYIEPVWSDDLTEASCAVGDAIHNLRSALDTTAYAISLKQLPSLPDKDRERVYFPFRKDRTTFEGSKGDIDSLLGAGAYDVIAPWQPYNGGNDLLWWLHRLDINDKHRHQPFIGNVSTKIPPGFVIGRSFLGRDTFLSSPKQEPWQPFTRKIVLTSGSLSEPPVSNHVHHEIHIALGDFPELAKYPVIDLLQKFAELVVRIVGDLDARFVLTSR